MKNKKKKAAKKTVQKKVVVSGKKKYFILGAIATLLALMIMGFFLGTKKSWVCDQNLLREPLTKSWQDPVFAQKYTENIIISVLNQVPKNTSYISIEMNQPVRQYLQSVLENGSFDQELKQILAGKKAAASGPQLTLIFIPDIHYSSISMTQSQNSAQHQSQISNYIAKHNFPLAFAEGFDYELTYSNMYRDLLKLAQREGIQLPSFDQFKQNYSTSGRMDVWHDAFIGKKTPMIVGIDHMPAVWMFHVLVELKENTSYLNHADFEEFTNYNLAWRDQLILANAVQAMRRRNLTQAPIVFGALHLYSFQPLCAQWGIRLEVQTLGLENYPEVPEDLRNLVAKFSKGE
ncbi:MAG: hypothetical protein NTX82_05760 [Candidatus Parcubacteria bacterium]|nr:hypothetical protein [Candidatus Parcubacteria bacterium]